MPKYLKDIKKTTKSEGKVTRSQILTLEVLNNKQEYQPSQFIFFVFMGIQRSDVTLWYGILVQIKENANDVVLLRHEI